jgi:nitrogen regulatory protein PII
MKSIFLVFNQVLSADVIQLLDDLEIRGFTRWTSVHGRGSETGEPRMGSHTWPELNDAMLCVVEDRLVPAVLERVRELDAKAPEQGLRAFVWNVEQVF